MEKPDLTGILLGTQVQVRLTIQRQWYTYIALDALLDAPAEVLPTRPTTKSTINVTRTVKNTDSKLI